MGYFQTVLWNAWKHFQKALFMPRKAVFFPLLLKVAGMVPAHRDRAWSQTQPAPTWIGNKLKSQAWFTELRLRSWSEPSHSLGQSEIRLLALDLSWACLGWMKSFVVVLLSRNEGVIWHANSTALQQEAHERDETYCCQVSTRICLHFEQGHSYWVCSVRALG